MTSRLNPVELGYSQEHDLTLDLHLSEDPTSDPLVVYIHGGGFARGDKSDDPSRLEALVRGGLTVASLNYRLAPTSHYPDPVDDVRRAVSALRARAGELGVNARSVGLIGASAGGYLAAMAAIRPGTDPASVVQAVSVWFSASDLVESTWRSPLERRILPITFEANLLGEDMDADLLLSASPARLDLHAAPPFLLIHGDSDKVVPPTQSAILHDALARHGTETTLIRLGRAGHEDPAFDSGPVPAMVTAWMRAHLLPAPLAAHETA